MGRIIDLQFNDKTYSIEYNRESVLKFYASQQAEKKEKDTMEVAIALIQCGLMKHHGDELPDRETIISWVLAMGDDLTAFVEELQKCIQEVLEVIQSEQKSKNLKWGVRK